MRVLISLCLQRSFGDLDPLSFLHVLIRNGMCSFMEVFSISVMYVGYIFTFGLTVRDMDVHSIC